MPARKVLSDYEIHCGSVRGMLARSVFNAADSQDYLDVKCTCGISFQSKKADLCARMNRGNLPKCTSCVNRVNSNKRFR